MTREKVFLPVERLEVAELADDDLSDEPVRSIRSADLQIL
jgi:hypothetical protein